MGEAASLADIFAAQVEVDEDAELVAELVHARGWGDGLPVVPATQERVARMLEHSNLDRHEIIARLAPNFGAATVERIAINAVMAGCRPASLPLLIAAVRAVSQPQFKLQSNQTTTQSVGAWVIVNGPIATTLGVSSGYNCLGHGSPANATIGRALRLILQNIGGALPGAMDRATQGFPGKYTFCCAENEHESPWEPLHVERGYAASTSTVTVVGASGTVNMHTYAREAEVVLQQIAETFVFPPSNDYWRGGEPWLVLCPEHAAILSSAGLSKLDVKRRLWQGSKMSASRMAPEDLKRTQLMRARELGDVTASTMLPISPGPEDIGILVAGGAGAHSVYIPTFGDTRSATVEIES